MMSEVIENALSEIGIPCYNIKRPSGVIPVIVYNYAEYQSGIGDNTEETTKYDVYINVFSSENINANNMKVKNALKNANFIKKVVNNPIQFEGDDFYQTTMNFIKIEVTAL